MTEKAFFNRPFLREFIRIYRERDCLWDKNSKDYRNENVRYAAYADLHGKLLEINKNATIQTVKSKIINIRTTFFCALKKFETSIKNGEEHSISLWYFPDLLFLAEKKIPKHIFDKVNEQKNDLIKYEEESRMVDLCLRTQQSVKKFINLYEKHECLWNVKSKYYSNKRMKLKALESIRKVFLKYSKNATILGIKNKIKSLRTCFKRELRKVESSRKKGEIYTPTLYYFKDLLFLVDNGPEISNLIDISDAIDSNEDNIADDYKEFENIDIESFYKPTTSTSTEQNVKDEENTEEKEDFHIEFIPKKDSKRPREEYIIEDSIDNKNDDSQKQFSEFENADIEDIYSQTPSDDYLEHFQQKIQNQSKLKDKSYTEEANNKEDEISTYAKYIGYELRLLSNEDRNYVQKLINDTLFEAKMGNANKLIINKK